MQVWKGAVGGFKTRGSPAPTKVAGQRVCEGRSLCMGWRGSDYHRSSGQEESGDKPGPTSLTASDVNEYRRCLKPSPGSCTHNRSWPGELKGGRAAVSTGTGLWNKVGQQHAVTRQGFNLTWHFALTFRERRLLLPIHLPNLHTCLLGPALTWNHTRNGLLRCTFPV